MLTVKPWKLELVMMLVAGLMVSLSLGALATLAVGKVLPGTPPGTLKFYNFLISSASFQGVTFVLLHHFLKLHGMNWSDFFGLRAPRLRRALGLAVATAVAVVPLTIGLNKLSGVVITLFNRQPEEQAVIKVLLETVGPGQRVCFAFTAVVLAPVVEEALFRGILYPLIKQAGRPRLALAVSSLLFAAIHYNLMTFVPLTFLAMALALLYEKTDTLLAPILTHALFNAVNLVMFFLVAR